MPDALLLVGASVFRHGRVEPDLAVAVEGGRIAALGREAERRGRRRARGLRRIDLGGAYLAPGFVDLHTHGALGVDFDLAGARELDAVIREHFLAHGVTRLLVSLCPASRRELIGRVARVARAIQGGAGGGAAGGIHLEGPFLNPRRPGALPGAEFAVYSAAYLDALLDAGRGLVRTMTVAPERRGGSALLAHLRRRRVVAAFGHSDADYRQAAAAIGAGVRYVTHLFNAMPGIHHRAPGPVSAFLADPRVRVELISDGHHVDAAVMRWVARVKSPGAICLVSDSVNPCGLRPGRYRFAGRRVELRGGRVTLGDGTLAGSALTLEAAFRIQVRDVGRLPAEVAVSAAGTPARIAGWHRQVGEIDPGLRADLVVLDRAFRVQATYLGGERVFARR